MKEFLLLIRTDGDTFNELSPEEQQAHVQKIGNYINNLVKEEKLKGAQPLEMEGRIISGKKGALKDGPFIESKEIIMGYYHILAEDMDEAMEIAKANPMLEKGIGRIEVRPIRTVEGIN